MNHNSVTWVKSKISDTVEIIDKTTPEQIKSVFRIVQKVNLNYQTANRAKMLFLTRNRFDESIQYYLIDD